MYEALQRRATHLCDVLIPSVRKGLKSRNAAVRQQTADALREIEEELRELQSVLVPARAGNPWMDHVRKVAAEKGMRMKDAMKVAKESYSRTSVH